MFSQAAVLLRIALANVVSSALNVFVGLVLLFGAALLVVVGALFTTLDGSLSKSVVDSISGQLQVYGARSKDSLEIYGKMDHSDSDLAPLDDFPALKKRLLAVPNVARVVPMGATSAMLLPGNAVDVTLEKLRTLYRQQSSGTPLPPDEFERRAGRLRRQVQGIIAVLARDVARRSELSTADLEPREAEALARTTADDFWAHFDEAPLEHLEFLENRIAPLVADGNMLFMRALGTDLTAYQAAFPRMVIVEGGPVPEGHRGLLMPRFFYEEYLKLKNARRLDRIKEALDAGRRLDDPGDKELQRLVRENQTQTRDLLMQLDEEEAATMAGRLREFLHSDEPRLEVLLHDFFGVTDGDFAARYRYFYETLAPMLTLYRAGIGDRLTLRSIGRSGGFEAVSLPLYGIFEYRGLEKSPLAGVNALIDIVSFRDLYGYLTPEQRAELQALKAQVGAKDVSREDAEAALFGGDATLESDADGEGFSEEAHEAALPDDGAPAPRRQSDTFAPEDVDDGVVLNAAVVLRDGSAQAQARTRRAIEAMLLADAPPPDAQVQARAQALAESGRGGFALSAALAPVLKAEAARATGAAVGEMDSLLDLQDAFEATRVQLDADDAATVRALLESARPKVWVVSWTRASGFLGKFIDFFRLLLGGVVGAFAFIALIVVTIGMTIATLQRTQTIGTMRAIGAQRGFVVAMVLTETAVLGLVFGLLGALVGAGVVLWLHSAGIPAWRDELYFFFSGPVLRPELTGDGVLLAVAVTMAVSLLAVVFPTVLATRVSPVTAMQEK